MLSWPIIKQQKKAWSNEKSHPTHVQAQKHSVVRKEGFSVKQANAHHTRAHAGGGG